MALCARPQVRLRTHRVRRRPPRPRAVPHARTTWVPRPSTSSHQRRPPDTSHARLLQVVRVPRCAPARDGGFGHNGAPGHGHDRRGRQDPATRAGAAHALARSGAPLRDAVPARHGRFGGAGVQPLARGACWRAGRAKARRGLTRPPPVVRVGGERGGAGVVSCPTDRRSCPRRRSRESRNTCLSSWSLSKGLSARAWPTNWTARSTLTRVRLSAATMSTAACSPPDSISAPTRTPHLKPARRNGGRGGTLRSGKPPATVPMCRPGAPLRRGRRRGARVVQGGTLNVLSWPRACVWWWWGGGGRAAAATGPTRLGQTPAPTTAHPRRRVRGRGRQAAPVHGARPQGLCGKCSRLAARATRFTRPAHLPTHAPPRPPHARSSSRLWPGAAPKRRDGTRHR